MTVVTARLAAKSYATEGDGRRRSERLPHTGKALVCSPTAFTSDESIAVTSINVSRHGVAFELRGPLAVGSFMNIELNAEGRRTTSEIRIIHCRQLKNGFYEVGAEFC